jgi:hypothetical protein
MRSDLGERLPAFNIIARSRLSLGLSPGISRANDLK